MKKVILKKMVISNFKGIHNLTATFGDATQVSGENGTGKTSLYEAYLWALFGKDHLGSEIAVQPLDKDNNIVHRVETTVDLIFVVNGIEIKVGRSLKENWTKPRGQAEEILKGRETTRFYNEVPVGETEFVKVLSSICPLEQWLILSSVDYLLSEKYGTEKRRALLNSIADGFNELEIAEDFPAALKVLRDNRDLNDYLKAIRLKKGKAKVELDQIPARIDQQEKLRHVADFSALRAELAGVDAKVAEIDRNMANSVNTSVLDESKKLSGALAEINNRIRDIEQKEDAAYSEKKRALQGAMYDYQSSLDIAKRSVPNLEATLANYNTEITHNEGQKQELKKKWITKNAEVPAVSVEEKCPFCGADYEADKVTDLRTKAVTEFNTQKKKALSVIEAEASAIVDRVKYLTAEIEATTKKLDADRVVLSVNQKLITELEEKIWHLSAPEYLLQSNKEYQTLKAEADKYSEKLAALALMGAQDENKEVLLREKSELADRRSALIAEIGQEDTNWKIDSEKSKLEQEAINLVQEIADIENEEYQIEQFKKARILKVQEAVDKHFVMVNFKMFEANLTNDGEKKICQAIIAGVPYESQNLATKINSGIDIVNGLSKVWEISVPLFVDQNESVTKLIQTQAQIITLSVSKEPKLTINILN